MATPIEGYPGYEGWDPVAAQADFKATGGTGKGGSSSGGSNAYSNISMNDVGGSAVDFANGLSGLEDKAFNDYVMASRGQEKPLDVYGRLENEAGIPRLRMAASTLSGQVNDLEDTIRNIEPTINATTKNSLVTEGQRGMMVTEGKRLPQERLGMIGTALGRTMQGIDMATGDINNKVGLTMQGQQQELDPYKVRMNMMSERASRMMTGFTSDRQTRLDILLQKASSQERLNNQEMQEAATLAQMEKKYELQKKEMDYQYEMENKNKKTSGGSPTITGNTNTTKPTSKPTFNSGQVQSYPNGFQPER